MFRRSVGDTSKQPYFHLSACRRSSGAGIQSAIQGEWVFTRRIEDCAKPPAPGVSQAALEIERPERGRWLEPRSLFERRALLDLSRGGVSPLPGIAGRFLRRFIVRLPGRAGFGHPGADVVQRGVARADGTQVLGSEPGESPAKSEKSEFTIDEVVHGGELRPLVIQLTLVGEVVEMHEAAARSSSLSRPLNDFLQPRASVVGVIARRRAAPCNARIAGSTSSKLASIPSYRRVNPRSFSCHVYSGDARRASPTRRPSAASRRMRSMPALTCRAG